MEHKTWTTDVKSAWGPGPWQDEPDKEQWEDPATGYRAPGLRLHPRTMAVQSASAQIHGDLLEVQQERGLTDAEMMTILAENVQRWAKFQLRAERHPDDPERKADEA